MPFLFYDLETSSINPRSGRIMQFGGVLTDEDFNIQDEWQTLIKLSEDILPEPDAVMVTKITPQKANDEGISEVEFLEQFFDKYNLKNLVIVGFNNIRFDDEFMRHTMWRNFYDPYKWEWDNSHSKWDMLDVVRMTRALRPEGINWPSDNGVATNRLELLTEANNIEHGAHDALGDAQATLEIARLIRMNNPKLFEYLLKARTKKGVAEIIQPGHMTPFVYSSGRFSSDYEKTTVAAVIGKHPTNNNGQIVYDLRFNPEDYADWDEKQIERHLFTPYFKRKELEMESFPAKVLQLNKSPAVAPLGVLDEASQERISLDINTVTDHLNKLKKNRPLIDKIISAWQAEKSPAKKADAELNLYQDLPNDKDKNKLLPINKDLGDGKAEFNDPRLNDLYQHYIARYFPQNMDDDHRQQWETYKNNRLNNGIDGGINMEKYFQRINQLAIKTPPNSETDFLLEELKLYGESLAPDLDA
jgi:exodeoxyribonuclease-1